MNPEGGKMWKKLANKDLILGPRVDDDALKQLSPVGLDMLKGLQDKLDDTFTVFDINTVINPATYEPFVKIVLMKTEKK